MVFLPRREPPPEQGKGPAEAGLAGVKGVDSARLALVVQRQAVEVPAGPPEPSPAGAGLAQRVSLGPPETGIRSRDEEPRLDLDDLARQVYPFIKRMVAVERERRLSR